MWPVDFRPVIVQPIVNQAIVIQAIVIQAIVIQAIVILSVVIRLIIIQYIVIWSMKWKCLFDLNAVVQQDGVPPSGLATVVAFKTNSFLILKTKTNCHKDKTQQRQFILIST
jgi:hypothetical protein